LGGLCRANDKTEKGVAWFNRREKITAGASRTTCQKKNPASGGVFAHHKRKTRVVWEVEACGRGKGSGMKANGRDTTRNEVL